MKVTLDQALRRLPVAATEAYPEGAPSAVMMAGGTMQLKIFAPGSNTDGLDRQQPHTQDELYIVQRGTATLHIGDQRFDAAPGDVLFVAAGVDHRFAPFTDDFVTWVVFYGPNGGET